MLFPGNRENNVTPSRLQVADRVNVLMNIIEVAFCVVEYLWM